MIKSMTGYGKAEKVLPNKKLYIEIRTLNSKQIDINAKIPSIYKEVEMKIRNLLAAAFERGKIDIILYYELNENVNHTKINDNIVADYYQQLNSIALNLNIKLSDNVVETLLKMPDVLKTEKDEIDEKEKNLLFEALEEATEKVNEFRKQEGKYIINDVSERISNILQLLDTIPNFEEARIQTIKERIQSNITDFMSNDNMDKNRLEQEVIYYIEKMDITEEKVRLKNHCNYFDETIQKGGSLGKKLGFISQEIGREINTIGSKANNTDIQKLVIQMKDELEKIKEQLMNVL